MKSRPRKRSRPWSWYQTWEPVSKRERVELSEPVDAESRDTDQDGIKAELRLMEAEQ